MVSLSLVWLLAFPVLPDAMAVAPNGEALEAAHHAKLKRGKILSALHGERGTTKTVVALGVVECSPSTVFKGLTNYDGGGHDMPYVSSLTVHRDEDDVVSLSYELDLPWPLADRYYTVRMDDQPADPERVSRSSWSYVPGSGNITDTSGSFEIVAYGEARSLVRYTAHVDPGGKIPKWALNMATKSSTPDILRTLRKRCAKTKDS